MSQSGSGLIELSELQMAGDVPRDLRGSLHHTRRGGPLADHPEGPDDAAVDLQRADDDSANRAVSAPTVHLTLASDLLTSGAQHLQRRLGDPFSMMLSLPVPGQHHAFLVGQRDG